MCFSTVSVALVSLRKSAFYIWQIWNLRSDNVDAFSFYWSLSSYISHASTGLLVTVIYATLLHDKEYFNYLCIY